MKISKYFIIIFFISILSNSYSQTCKQIIGYYPGWQWYDRNQLVNPISIKYSNYTIINYAFFEPQLNGSITGADVWADENILQGQIDWSQNPPGHFPNTSLVDKAHLNNVKVLISVGGWTFSNNFPSIAASLSTRISFAHSCIELCRKYNLDGIDIDWEYPGFAEHNGTPADRQNFTLLLKQVKDSLNAYGISKGKSMLLTAALGASQTHMSNVEWNNVKNILDYINLMTYDYFGSWDPTANHNSPLYAPSNGDTTFNINSSVNYLVNHYGVSAAKINIGLAFYGRSAKTTGTPVLFAPINGVDATTFPDDDGIPLYYNILKKINLYSENWDSRSKAPYLTGNGTLKSFVSFDNLQSISLKANYINNKNLAGGIIWEITGDYLETTPGSGIISGTPLSDTLHAVLCSANPNCPTPYELNAVPSPQSAILSWQSAGASMYLLQYKLKSENNWSTTFKKVYTSTYILNQLSSCTDYQFRVSAMCGNSKSPYSQLFDFKTTGCTASGCNVPSGLYSSGATGTSVSLHWNSTGALNYTINYKKSSDPNWSVRTSSSNNITLSGLTQCNDYNFKVRSNCQSTKSEFSSIQNFSTTGCPSNPCTAPSTFYFDSANYIPLGELKLGQGRLYELWGVTADAYIPANRKLWAISMIHAHHLFRNITKTSKIPVSFYFSTALKESFCGCDPNMQPVSSPFPLSYQANSVGDGCFQIENNSAYAELRIIFPNRFPAGGHSSLISGDNFETAALCKAYYDIFGLKFLEISKGWNPVGFFNDAADSNAAVKIIAMAYNRGLWYPDLGVVLSTDRTHALSLTSISEYFASSGFGYDYQKVLTQYCNVLENNTYRLDSNLRTINPQTGQPYNYFINYYDPQISWNDVKAYIDSISILYPEVNIANVKSAVQTKFNSINSGNPVSFRYQLGGVLNKLIMLLPADDPTTAIASNYGCVISGNSKKINPPDGIKMPIEKIKIENSEDNKNLILTYAISESAKGELIITDGKNFEMSYQLNSLANKFYFKNDALKEGAYLFFVKENGVIIGKGKFAVVKIKNNEE